MSPKRKYLTLTSLVTALFLYLLSSEVSDRWSEAFGLHQSVLEQEAEVKPPEELALQKSELLARKRLLLASATQGQKSFEHSQTGVVEFLNHCAKSVGVKYSTLTPLSAATKGEITEIRFSFTLQNDFVSAVKLVSAIETGPLSCEVTNVKLTSKQPRHKALEVTVEGNAYIFPKASS